MHEGTELRQRRAARNGIGGDSPPRSRSRSPRPAHPAVPSFLYAGATATGERPPRPLAVRLLHWGACVLLGVALAMAGLIAAVVYSDTVATPVLSALVRANMPRPSKSSATAAAADQGQTYKDFAEMEAAADARLREELWMAGRKPESDGASAVDMGAHRPSTGKYGRHQWLWDSMLHIHIAGRGGDGNALFRAVKELFSLLSFQDDSNGFIPEMVYWEPDPNQQGVPGLLFGYSDSRRTDLTQMPIVAFALESINERLKEAASGQEEAEDLALARLAVLCQAIPRIHRYHEWWLQRRDPDGDGLVSILHPWESGLDASPLYDDVHRRNRARRSGSSDGWADAAGRPTPDELYPELILLLRRYKHKAKWLQSRILDPVAAQQRCDTDGDKGVDLRDARSTAWNVRAPLGEIRKELEKHSGGATSSGGAMMRARGELDRGSIIDGIFDVEDVGVNAVLSANAMTLVRLYDDFLATFEALSPSARARFAADSERRDACCWTRPVHSRPAPEQRIAKMKRKRDEMHKLATALAVRISDAMWDRDKRQFISFHHSYQRQSSGSGGSHLSGVCMVQHALTRDTVQSLMPLLLAASPAAVLTEEMASALVAKLEDPDAYGPPSGEGATATVPTVSRRERDVYETQDSTLMWRGPSWPTTNWFVAKGLQAVANCTRLPRELRERAAAVHRDLLGRWTRMHLRFGFWEFHNPETGEGQGQRGLGMSHTLVDIAHSALSKTPSLISSALEESIRSPASAAWAQQRRPSSPLNALIRRGVVKAARPGLPKEGVRAALYPTMRRLLLGDRDGGDGPTPSPPGATASENDEGPEEAELLMEPSGSHQEWRVMPKLVPGCCF